MQTVIEKASVLIEALPFIQKFRGETIVVKFGGSIMDNEEGVREILNDVAFMECVGLRPVLVHGGGKAISARMKEAGLTPRFVRGLRVSDAETVEIVERVLNIEINPHMVASLESFGCKARGIHGDDILKVRKHVEIDPETGSEIDWGFVGDIEAVDVEPVKAFLGAAMCPVLTPLGRGADRKVYNINADDVASAVARALQARKLVFLSDVPGLLADPRDPTTVISSLRAVEVDSLIKRGVIAGGMLPKISGAVNAVRSGVQKAHIIDSAMPHSLLLELFTEQGVGTEIIQ
ncbi:MAG: acetylglutamate kinase [Kiritimatiellia bacterium]|nr:acetylglutamate kinase [Kiritimatiellia bacterium]